MATLKDVAQEAGLTVTTVSRVLNNRGYISDDARKRVHDAVEKLHYHPNEAARSLQNSSLSRTIGLIVPHIRHPYFSELINQLENEARKREYNILLFNSQKNIEKMEEYMNLCVANRVAGMILCSGSVDISLLKKVNMPLITLESYAEACTSSIECDNRQGGGLAARCLADCGCKHLLYVGGQEGIPMPADRRAEGFVNVCREREIEHIECTTYKYQFDAMDYVELFVKVLREHPETDGIFASSDMLAAHAIQACRRLDIKVPDQMQIVGFDDVMVSTLTTPQLTTIHQPILEMAQDTVRCLTDILAGEIVPRRIMLPVTLVERGSTRQL
ncbi:MAG: LacI family transcriptional regulator [Clostridiales bacterium]|nr:LacI family transcriptional regulator [Clostridiales bacterium]